MAMPRYPRTISQNWDELIATYLSNNNELKLVMLLVDIRRDLEG